MSEAVPPGHEVFSEDDLLRISVGWLACMDTAAACVAVVALGLWTGGLIALGACAAPLVFKFAPYPFSGQAMGAAFARFDNIAIGCGVTALAAEFLRTFAAMRSPTKARVIPRIRRYLAIGLALGAVYGGVALTPAIMRAHAAGVRRNVGPEGAELERIHKQAELIGKVTVPLAVGLMVLHMLTLRSRED